MLCSNELNLNYKKRGYPFVHTEAKISMALYLRWVELKYEEQSAEDEDFLADKENIKPSLTQEEMKEIEEKYADKSNPIELNSGEFIQFLIKESVV